MSIFHDLRIAARTLTKDAKLSLVGVVGLGLGIGLTTAMFSIVNGAVLRGLPFDQPNRLMHVERSNSSAGIEDMEVTIHDYEAWKAGQSSFDGFAAFYTNAVSLVGSDGVPERLDGAFVTANLFEVLRVQAARGRLLTEEDGNPGSPAVMVLGHSTWANRFNSDPNIIGRQLLANGASVTIVGVMPEGFRFPLFQDLWMPLRLDSLRIPRGEGTTLEVVGRLGEGSSRKSAQSDLETISASLARDYPETNQGVRPVVKSYIAEMLSQRVVNLLYTMLFAVFGVLLIACANVANLLLARASLQTQDIAIRSALGASRKRLILNFVGEAAILSIFGGVLGLALARVAISLFNRSIQHLNLPFWIDIRVDPMAVLVVVGLTALTAFISGLIPGWKATGTTVAEFLKDASRGSTSLRLGRLTKSLVIVEIALSFGLLVAAGLMIKSVATLSTFDFGFETETVLTGQIALPEAEYDTDQKIRQFFVDLEERLRARPNIRAVGLLSALPAVGAPKRFFGVEGKAYESNQAYPYAGWLTASPGLFGALGVAVLEGRGFERSDNADSVPVALVNASFRRRFFRDGGAIGRRIRGGRSTSERPWRTIVGVVPDLLTDTISSTEQEAIYVPVAQSPEAAIAVLARTQGEPLEQARELRQAVSSLDGNLPVFQLASLDRVIKDNTWFYSVFGGLFMVFGLASLFLALIGLYGVLAFSVSRRTKEIALRLALGAEAPAVRRMLMKQGFRQIGLGLLFGFILAAVLSQFLRFLLLEVSPWDPLVFGTILIALVVTGAGACLLSSRSVTKVDAVQALRGD